jgi:protease-4
MSRLRLPAAATLALAFTAPGARADNSYEPQNVSPTRALLVPGASLAGDADATAVEIAPGQLALVDASSTALLFNQWADGSPREGRGLAAFRAFPLLVGRLSLGAGLAWLRPSQVGEPDSYYKLDLGLGARLGRASGVGMVWEHLFGSRYDGFDTFSVGWGARLHSTLALGLAVRDIFRPRPFEGAERVPREWDAELALRPTGTPALELTIGSRLLEPIENHRFQPHGRLVVGVARGLALFAEVDPPRRPIAFVDSTGTRHEVRDFRAMAGIVASLDRYALTATAIESWRHDPAADDYALHPGASIMLRAFEDRRPAALVSLPYVARLRISGMEGDRELAETLFRLRRLADDRAVGAVLLEIDALALGYARIEELRAVITALGRRKPVFAWLAQADSHEYYLASACQKIGMHPAGGLLFAGLTQTVTFYKGALDRLGVGVDLVRIAEYKGAMEPFVMNEQSEPVRRNRNAVLDDVYGRLIAEVAAARSQQEVSTTSVKQVVEHGLFTPADAKSRGLVDEIADERQMIAFVHRSLGTGWPVRDADLGRRTTGRWRPPRIAVVLVDGAITDGRPHGLPPFQGTVAWADLIIDALGDVARDPSVRALVLRVNSPGGSAFASDRIARAVAGVRAAGKPVIASLGDTAASGGYYIAAPADLIIGAPSTITGSIGIFAFKPDVAGLLARVGLTTETVKRGSHADFFSLYRPWSEDERATMMAQLQYSYRQFLHTVADGRKTRGLTEDRVDQLGRGRIFTGAQAAAAGLVDRLGGLDAAIDEAVRRSGVPTGAGALPEIVVLPPAPPNPLETLLALRGLTSAGESDDAEESNEAAAPAGIAEALTAFVARHGRAAARLILPLLLGEPAHVQARMPYELELR